MWRKLIKDMFARYDRKVIASRLKPEQIKMVSALDLKLRHGDVDGDYPTLEMYEEIFDRRKSPLAKR